MPIPPGYVDESVNQVEVGTVGAGGTSVETSGINRNLNQLLQSQLWTETSGGSYADMTSTLYQQLQNIYGTPNSSTSFDAIYNKFIISFAFARDQSRLSTAQYARRRCRTVARAEFQFDDGRHSANPHPGLSRASAMTCSRQTR